MDKAAPSRETDLRWRDRRLARRYPSSEKRAEYIVAGGRGRQLQGPD